MSEMIERVARAIESRMRTSPAGQDIGMDIARAAIEAMRPVEADLKAAGCDNDNSGAPYCADCSYLADQFGKFIDAALK